MKIRKIMRLLMTGKTEAVSALMRWRSDVLNLSKQLYDTEYAIEADEIDAGQVVGGETHEGDQDDERIEPVPARADEETHP